MSNGEYYTPAITWWESFSNDFYQNFIYDDRWQWMLNGLWITLQVSVIGILLGIVLGIIIAVMRMTKVDFFHKFGLGFLDKISNWLLFWISYVYLDIIRGTPAVTQLLIWHFAIRPILGVDPIVTAMIAIGINSSAYVAEIIRAGVLSIDKGQTEAGRTLGLSTFTTMATIVMPQAVKNILPTLVNEFIVLIKETAILGFAALDDLNRAARHITANTLDVWTPLVVAAIMYYIVIKILTIFLRMLERRLRKADVR